MYVCMYVPNQNGFRPDRSTTSHILAFRRIVEELNNHNKEAVIVFIDFKKAFDSIDRNVMFKILEAYGILQEIVDAIKIMYTNTSAISIYNILRHVLHKAINQYDGITLKRRISSRHPAEHLADLGYADDIALLGDTVHNAQDLLIKVELACQAVVFIRWHSY